MKRALVRKAAFSICLPRAEKKGVARNTARCLDNLRTFASVAFSCRRQDRRPVCSCLSLNGEVACTIHRRAIHEVAHIRGVGRRREGRSGGVHIRLDRLLTASRISGFRVHCVTKLQEPKRFRGWVFRERRSSTSSIVARKAPRCTHACAHRQVHTETTQDIQTRCRGRNAC